LSLQFEPVHLYGTVFLCNKGTLLDTQKEFKKTSISVFGSDEKKHRPKRIDQALIWKLTSNVGPAALTGYLRAP
jgi:hypothetical protein